METEKQSWQKNQEKRKFLGSAEKYWLTPVTDMDQNLRGDSSSVTSAHKLGTPGRLTHHTSWYSFSSCKWAVNSTVFKIAVCLCFLYVLRGYWFHVGFKCWLFSSDWVAALQFIRFYLCQTNTVDGKMWSPFLASLNHTVLLCLIFEFQSQANWRGCVCICIVRSIL